LSIGQDSWHAEQRMPYFRANAGKAFEGLVAPSTVATTSRAAITERWSSISFRQARNNLHMPRLSKMESCSPGLLVSVARRTKQGEPTAKEIFSVNLPAHNPSDVSPSCRTVALFFKLKEQIWRLFYKSFTSDGPLDAHLNWSAYPGLARSIHLRKLCSAATRQTSTASRPILTIPSLCQPHNKRLTVDRVVL
jgi:hypothetical protein